MGRIYGDVMPDECDAGRASFYFFDSGDIAIHKDDGDVSAVYVILPADNDDVAFHGYLRSCGIIHTSSRYLSKCLYDTVSQLMFLAVFSFMVHFMVVCSLIS